MPITRPVRRAASMLAISVVLGGCAATRDAAHPQYTDHYFTGDYPTRLLDKEIAQGRNEVVERQLSFLVDA